VSGLRTIVLIGPMGAGKSTVGRILADRLERPLVDSDVVIWRSTGMSAADIAETGGVERLHAIEALVLERCLERSQGAVIAAAASVVDVDDLVDRLREGREFVGLLMAHPDVCLQRSLSGGHRRTMTDEEHIELIARRMDSYRRAADIELDTTSLDAIEVAELLINAIWVSWP
jgi:shikimate kinase